MEFVSPEYQAQLDDLATTLTERFRTVASNVLPFVLNADKHLCPDPGWNAEGDYVA